jgi:hypothetical protein
MRLPEQKKQKKKGQPRNIIVDLVDVKANVRTHKKNNPATLERQGHEQKKKCKQ